MTHRTALSGTTAILFALAGTAAQADVTGAEVWSGWKAAAESVGQTVTAGSVVQDGDTLTVRDISVAMRLEELNIDGTIGVVTFTENGDGTVAVAFSPSYALMMESRPAIGEAVDATITIAQPNLAMTASGEPDAISYEFSGPEMIISVSDVVVDGAPLTMTANATLSELAGTYFVQTGENSEIESSLDAAKLDVVFGMDNPDGEAGRMDVNLSYTDISATSAGSLLMLADPTAVGDALAAGMSTMSKIDHGAATFMIDFKDGVDDFAMNGSSGSGLLEVGLGPDGLSYNIGNTALDMTITASDMPLPEVAFQLAELGFNLAMPVTKSDEPNDFAFGITLGELSVSDMIWGMIDPAAQLPRDPATLIIDTSGRANWAIDIMNPESAGMTSGMPGQVHALDINALRLDIAGAELTGTGSFTFNNDDLATFGGIPAPTGMLDLALTGANGLMDTLVGMGLLPQEQAMGARMMMGMFARPGEGPDSLVSKIEIDGASGAISANGQRIR